MCCLACSNSRSMTSFGRLFLFRAWSRLNAVHGGDPITTKGLLSCTNFFAFFRISSLEKSQAKPDSGSDIVRSSDHPGRSARPPYFLMPASCAILGGEKISATSELILLNISGALFRVSSTRMSVGSGSCLLTSLSGVSSGRHSWMMRPVRTHRTTRHAISDSAGPLLVVSTRPVAAGKVRATMPDPM